MNKKVILILVDGMRPDALEQCGHPFVQTLKNQSLYTLNASTVMPSVTLPCHMSLFHSVPSDRHGIITNFYTPQVRPVKGLCEVLKAAGKTSAFYYTWEELRDLTRPDSLAKSCFINIHNSQDTDKLVTKACIEDLREYSFDFTFLYLGETDNKGHKYGWMSKEQLTAIHNSVDCIQKVYEAFGEEYTVIVTADHGGHGRGHGSDMPEDMTIPLFICGEEKGQLTQNISIMDIAPSIVKLIGLESDPDWNGKSVL